MFACYTAVDFRARLRFPRAAGEPTRRFHSCGVSLSPLPAGVFVLPSNQQLEAATYMNVHYTNKNPNKFDSQSRIKLVRIFL
ncbi:MULTISPECIES: hypothetical protein [Priestia]|uniref:hypothetical protein n=1 Tax=Priestia TaxID=2800373 RepID=UPI0015F6DC6F|nr:MULTISPECIES: hypothetical protein [Priestia]UYP09686.1 hypothetical protein OIJ04_08810 [Priestia megaterium]